MQRSDRRFYPNLLRQITTLIVIVGTIIVNTLTNLFPPSGTNIGQLANSLLKPVLIIPANYAFAIWGMIYLGLIAFGIYQALPAQRHDFRLQQASYLLILASLAQIAWIFLFQARLFVLSVLAMLGILLPLIAAYLHLNIARERMSRQQKWFVYLPFSIYLGWISVAMVVNVAAALYTNGWQGWGLTNTTWTLIMVAVTAVLGGVVTVRRSDVAFGWVIVWALAAIAVRHNQSASILLWLPAGGLAIALAVLILSRQRRIRIRQ